MDNIAKRLGNNIRVLRKAHGDTQEILADIIGVGITALSNYENGKRLPDDSILKAIAFRYHCPVDYLKSDDFSILSSTNTLFDDENLLSLLDATLPVIELAESRNDFFFTKGYENTKEAIECLKNDDVDSAMHYFDKANDAYETSLKVSKTIESAANILVSLFTVQNMIVIDDYIDDENESQYRDSHGNISVSKFMPRISKKYSPEDMEEKRTLRKYIRKESGKYIMMLKKNREYSDLADFYIALRYAYSVDKSNFGQDNDKFFGIEMMKAFKRFGNKYAKTYIEALDKAMLHE